MQARQTLIKILLPGLIVGTLYIVFVAVGLIREEASVATALVRSERDAERAAASSDLARNVERAEKQLAAAQTRQQELSARAEELCAGMCAELPYTELIGILSSLFGRHGLVLEKEHPPTTGAPLPTSLQLVQRRLKASGGPAPALWEFSLRGSFGAMRAALDELSRSELHILPIALDMEPAEEQRGLRWRLVVWL